MIIKVIKKLIEKNRQSYYKFCDHLLKINPLINNDLPLLNILKLSNHEILTHYIYSLKQYAALIIKIDLNITQNEKKSIKKINELIDMLLEN